MSKELEEQIKEILLKHDIQNRLDVELLAELTNLLTKSNEEAVRGFYKWLDPNACHDPYYLEDRYNEYLTLQSLEGGNGE